MTPSRPSDIAPPTHGAIVRAFTLLEILVVLAILGLLAGLTINHLGSVHEHASRQIASIWVTQTIKTPLMVYRLQQHRFPTTEEGLQALVVAPPSAQQAWGGPYLDPSVVPPDPWGQPYQYMSPGKHNPDSYDVWSKGPDGESGTGDDIGNWSTASITN